MLERTKNEYQDNKKLYNNNKMHKGFQYNINFTEMLTYNQKSYLPVLTLETWNIVEYKECNLKAYSGPLEGNSSQYGYCQSCQYP